MYCSLLALCVYEYKERKPRDSLCSSNDVSGTIVVFQLLYLLFEIQTQLRTREVRMFTSQHARRMQMINAILKFVTQALYLL
jgi:hypothetical protein